MLVAANIITADMVQTGILQSEIGNSFFDLDNGILRISHGGTEYSQMDINGFGKKYPYGEASYLNNLYVATIITADPGLITDVKPDKIRHYLPQRFREQKPRIIPVVKKFVTDFYDYDNDRNSNVKGSTSDIHVDIVETLNTTQPYIDVEGYVSNFYQAYDSSYNKRSYSGLEIVILMLMD